MIKVFLVFMLVNFATLAVYCRIERYIDKKKFVHNLNLNISKEIKGEMLEKQSAMKKVYHWVNTYAYGWMRYNVLIVGNIPSYRLRNLLYRTVFAMQISRNTVIFGGCEFRSPWNINAGNCTISANCILDGRGRIVIEDNVVIGSGVHIWTEEHSANDPYFRVLKENIQPVIIEKYAWVCSDSSILPGVKIKEGVILASKACATKDCEEYSIYGGIPAKKIADRNRDLRYELSGKVSWHFM